MGVKVKEWKGAWWVFIPSGLCVALSALGLAWINFGMDEITNPRLRAEKKPRRGWLRMLFGGRLAVREEGA